MMVTNKFWECDHRLANLAWKSFFVIACTLLGWASYPTLEGWEFWIEWQAHGTGYYILRFEDIADRPLHWVPSLIAWLIPGPFDLGLQVVGILLAFSRWALAAGIVRTFLLSRYLSVMFVFLCITMPAWQFSGLDRFHAAQLSFSFLLFAWYCFSRYLTQSNFFWLILTSTGLICSLCAYQALFFVILFFPLMIFVTPGPLRRHFWTAQITFGLAAVGYITFRSISMKFFPKPYTTIGTNAEFHLEYLLLVYQTVWRAGFISWLPIVAASIAMVHGAMLRGIDRMRATYLAIAALALAPLSGMVYYFSSKYWLLDSDRIMFPVQAWMIAAFLVMVAFSKETTITSRGTIIRGCTAIMAVVWIKPAIVMCYCVWFQITFYSSLKHLVADADPSTPIRLEDSTGICGNYYTCWHYGINKATQSQGIPGNFTICRNSMQQKQKAPGPSHPHASPAKCSACTDPKTQIIQVQPGFLFAGYPLTVNLVRGQ